MGTPSASTNHRLRPALRAVGLETEQTTYLVIAATFNQVEVMVFGQINQRNITDLSESAQPIKLAVPSWLIALMFQLAIHKGNRIMALLIPILLHAFRPARARLV